MTGESDANRSSPNYFKFSKQTALQAEGKGSTKREQDASQHHPNQHANYMEGIWDWTGIETYIRSGTAESDIWLSQWKPVRTGWTSIMAKPPWASDSSEKDVGIHAFLSRYLDSVAGRVKFDSDIVLVKRTPMVKNVFHRIPESVDMGPCQWPKLHFPGRSVISNRGQEGYRALP